MLCTLDKHSLHPLFIDARGCVFCSAANTVVYSSVLLIIFTPQVGFNNGLFMYSWANAFLIKTTIRIIIWHTCTLILRVEVGAAIYKSRHTSIRIPTTKIRRSHDWFSFTTEFPILGKTVFFIEMDPGLVYIRDQNLIARTSAYT